MCSAEGSALTYNCHGGTQLKSGRGSYWWLTYKVTAFLLLLQKHFANIVTKRELNIFDFPKLTLSEFGI